MTNDAKDEEDTGPEIDLDKIMNFAFVLGMVPTLFGGLVMGEYLAENGFDFGAIWLTAQIFGVILIVFFGTIILGVFVIKTHILLKRMWNSVKTTKLAQ